MTLFSLLSTGVQFGTCQSPIATPPDGIHRIQRRGSSAVLSSLIGAMLQNDSRTSMSNYESCKYCLQNWRLLAVAWHVTPRWLRPETMISDTMAPGSTTTYGPGSGDRQSSETARLWYLPNSKTESPLAIAGQCSTYSRSRERLA